MIILVFAMPKRPWLVHAFQACNLFPRHELQSVESAGMSAESAAETFRVVNEHTLKGRTMPECTKLAHGNAQLAALASIGIQMNHILTLVDGH